MRLRSALGLFPARDPLFLTGLAIRLVLVLLAVPRIHSEWFIPFFSNALEGGLFSPYSAHLAQGGDLPAFPYGVVMYLAVLPLVTIGAGLDRLTGATVFAGLGLNLTILLLDLALLALLVAMRPAAKRRILLLYWLSPIVLYVCYWHGQLDVVPVVLLMLSLFLLFREQPAASGVAMAAAISSKLSMALAGPIVLIYLVISRRRRHLAAPMVLAGTAASLVLHLPVLASPAARSMVLGTPELSKVYDFSIRLSDGLEIYLLPVAYLLLLISAWLIRRISAQLLLALVAVGFLVIVLMTPASPGWYLWFTPFLALTFAETRQRIVIFVFGFGALFFAFHLLRLPGSDIPLWGIDLSMPVAEIVPLPERGASILLSVLFAGGLMLCLLLMREGVLRNDYFRLSRRPLMIGIAGDSSTGKDQLASSLTGLFGAAAVTHVSGDDYHLWDRHKPMWQVMTHLNPSANDLQKFREDLFALSSGQTVKNRHYDHDLGRMNAPRTIASNEVILATGLHALYESELNNRFDVRIFLDMEDSLRTFLKLRRDVQLRGHEPRAVFAAIRSRQLDRERFIQPQAAKADLVMGLEPLHPLRIDEVPSGEGAIPNLRLRVQVAQGTPTTPLIRTLVGVCGLHVDRREPASGERLEFMLEGDLDPEDTALAASAISAGLDDLLDARPKWLGGPAGMMQLFVLNQVAHALKKRLLWP